MRPVDQLFSCEHVIDDSQLTALSIARGPNQVELNLNFSSRSNQQIMVGISQCFVNLLRHVPNGAVAFFPSYSFLTDFVKSVRVSGHLAQIEKVKPIFVESRDGRAEEMWSKFCNAAKLTRQGALLLSVVGGKLSEGINFSDELGRCVFMVGLPYANKSSLELKERMKYVEEHIGSGAGDKFYETLCIQSVNQAIGRVIRHRNDHAAIILLDVRYSKANIALPGWIKKRLSHCQTFAEALIKLISFFKAKDQ
uniref:ATP-dependent helicase C-terminal domain-containing protein n=1 Tax=Ditylenchus dipsaci TaxID=166011 RepID=A0A915ERX0_9BILA